jgi:predicted PurR-regulated permease PerM
MQTEHPQPFYFRLSMILFMFLLIAVILYFGRDVFVPLALSFLIAVLLVPMNKSLEKTGLSRLSAITVSLLIAFVLIFGLIYFLSTQILSFLDDIPQIKQRLNDLIFIFQKWLKERFGISFREQATYINSAKDSGTGFIGTTMISLKDTLFVLTLLPIYTFLLLYYRDQLKTFLITVFSDRHKSKVQDVLTESRGVVQNYMLGLLLELAIVAVINWTGFLIIGIEYAIFLAIFAAVMNLIPYIGMLIASIFCMLVTLTTSPEPTDAVWTLVVLWVVQFIDNNIIMPKVVGSKVKINALMTIIGVLIGSILCGVAGMFLSIPTIAILKVIFERVDGLKPWGLLLSDDIAAQRPNRILELVDRLTRKPPLKV